ncbi:glycine cleavage system protein GcvH [Paenibacillus cremeus]|uniref:Glycine cleavage system H protein n=1 Tax=Paenibacillus cremeus TaxID=2163881 RepID=A0A559K4M1_9BACL|nr:glycine cleavage system protein GcvH [Paenibacillus cremeus]TVY07089.1 glycine cleavage system protein GcvH [Paenibacillus cremeus]
MSTVRPDLLYSEEHEWAEVLKPGTVRVGISAFAQSQLGDIVFVELPELGQAVQAGESLGTIESVKTVSDLFAPVSGKVSRINEELLNKPEAVNEDPYGEGWMVEIELDSQDGEALKRLLTAEQYEAYIEAAH